MAAYRRVIRQKAVHRGFGQSACGVGVRYLPSHPLAVTVNCCQCTAPAVCTLSSYYSLLMALTNNDLSRILFVRWKGMCVVIGVSSGPVFGHAYDQGAISVVAPLRDGGETKALDPLILEPLHISVLEVPNYATAGRVRSNRCRLSYIRAPS